MAWAALLLLVFEVAVARSDAFWELPERSTSGAFHVLERRVMRRRPDPVVAVVGSSRARDAVLPSVLEERLGLERGDVVNLGVTAGSSVDARELLRRDPEWFGRARVLVVVAEDWWFLAGRPLNERECRFASFDELRQAWDSAPRAAWERGVRTVPAARRLGAVLRAGPRVFRRMRLDAEDRLSWRVREGGEGPATVDVLPDVERYYGDGRESELRAGALREVVAAGQRLGLRVVLARVPWRDAYVEAAARLHPAAWSDWQRRLRGLADEAGVPLIAADGAASAGLRPVHFRDYGHLTDDGARLFSRWLAERLAVEAGSALGEGPR